MILFISFQMDTLPKILSGDGRSTVEVWYLYKMLTEVFSFKNGIKLSFGSAYRISKAFSKYCY